MTPTEPSTADLPVGGTRPLRADAQRNRERLITVARAAFAQADDTVAIESIARDAGVGIGTLYRHFPTREVLVEAVYAAEIDDLLACTSALLAELPPDQAFRAWVERYAQFAATKRGMIDTLRAGWASGQIATPTTRERVTAAIATLLAAGAEKGLLRADVEPEDIVALLLGIFLFGAANNDSTQTGRLLDLIVDAVRPRSTTGSSVVSSSSTG